MKILIVEDEEELSISIETYLSSEGYTCETVINYEAAMDKIARFDYSCILLDLMLPDGNGMKILEHLKNYKKEDGVIIISAKNSMDDKIEGLLLGADDYLSKPFHLAELSARIYAVIRRKVLGNSNLITHHEITVDFLSKIVLINKTELHLTKSEYNLLIYFISNKGKNLSKSAIAEYLSGDMADMLASFDFIYSHIKNLKKKLKNAGAKDYLTTLYGLGYRWEI